MPPGQHADGDSTTVARVGHILVVDDEAMIRSLLSEILTGDGHEVALATDGEQAIKLLLQHHFDLIITDIVMPGKNGVEVLRAAKHIHPEYPVIVITGYPSVNTAVRLVNLGATDYITKPFNVDLIRITVAKVLEMASVREAARDRNGANQVEGAGNLAEPYNFIMFNQLLEKEVARSGWRGHVCSLFMAEIDYFERYILEGRGPAGDQLLKTLTLLLRKVARPGDMMGRTDQAEFALILPETGRNEAREIGQTLRRMTGQSFTISAGIACFPTDATDAGGLIKVARKAVQTARSWGGDVIVISKKETT